MQRLQGTEQTEAKKNAKHNIHKQDIHTDSSSIDQIAYDMLYLASIGINNPTKNKPDEKCLEHYRTNEENRKALFRMSARHFIDALVGTTLKKAGLTLELFERIERFARMERISGAAVSNEEPESERTGSEIGTISGRV